MPVLRIPTPLRAYTNGQTEVIVNGANISEALADLTDQYPTIKPHIFSEGGELRPFVNLFIGEHNIKDLQGVNTPIKDGERIMLIPSIAGGCHCADGAPSEAIAGFGNASSQWRNKYLSENSRSADFNSQFYSRLKSALRFF